MVTEEDRIVFGLCERWLWPSVCHASASASKDLTQNDISKRTIPLHYHVNVTTEPKLLVPSLQG